jgi:hypothetical protein
VEGVVLGLELVVGVGMGEGRVWYTFLPITPRQAIDGIAILLCGFKTVAGCWGILSGSQGL